MSKLLNWRILILIFWLAFLPHCTFSGYFGPAGGRGKAEGVLLEETRWIWEKLMSKRKPLSKPTVVPLIIPADGALLPLECEKL